MEKKFYTIILLLLFSSLGVARAQDTTLCNPNFGFSANGSQVSFQAVDVHSTVMHQWRFGDSTQTGLNSNLASTSHTYSHSGTFVVIHVIKDSLNGACFGSTSHTVYVNASPACGITFQAIRDTVNHRLYNFYSSYTSAGAYDSISWFINDTLAGTGPVLTNNFVSDGNYTICVKLAGSNGCQAEQCQQIEVRGTDSVVHTDSCGIAPMFSTRVDSSDSRHIYFTPLPDSSSYSYVWDFGDGISTTLPHPDHTYTYGGTYNISLTVTKHNGADSCQAHTSGVLVVAGASRDTCAISFVYMRNPSNPNLITFNALDSIKISTDSLTWQIFKLTDSLHPVFLIGRTPTYLLPDSGCYVVLLSAITAAGCQSSSQQTICTDSVPGSGHNFISCYPNPAVSQANLTLNLARAATIRVSIFNSMGNQVLTTLVAGNKGPNHISLPISNLPKGVYYVEIQYGNETRRSKIQKL